MFLNKNYVEQLSEIYLTDDNVVLLKGGKGLLKSATVKEFLQDKPYYISIFEHIGTYSLENIYDAVLVFYQQHVKKYSKIYKSLTQLPIEQKLMALIKYLCDHFKLIFYFDNVIKANETILQFITAMIMNSKNYLKIPFIIIEIDTDESPKDNSNILYKNLYSCRNLRFINFQSYQASEIKDYLKQTYSNLIYNESDMKYLLENTYGNIGILSILLNILVEDALLIKNGTAYELKNIPIDFFYNAVADYINKKYSELNLAEQEVLKKSACIGMTFDCRTLKTVFNILSAYELLENIRKQSDLITKDKTDVNCNFTFKTKDVYKYVINMIPDNHKVENHRKLCEYFYALLLKDNKVLNQKQYLKDLYQYLHHSILACRLMQIKSRIKEIVHFYLSISDCERAIIFIDNIESYYEIHDLETYQYLLCAKAEIKYRVGEYSNAVDVLESISKLNTLSEDEKFFIRYKLADAYLMTDQVQKSEQILLDLESHLVERNNDFHKDLLMRVYRSLASLYDFLNNHENALKYFTNSIKLSKTLNNDDFFYSLIRQSSMCYPLCDAQNLMEQALDYYQQRNNLVEMAKCKHNIATDALYLSQYALLKIRAEQSIEVFNSYGSFERVSPMITLAIYYVMHDNNVSKATQLLNDALTIANSDWVKITVLNNLTTLALLKRDLSQAYKLIKQMEEIYTQDMPVAYVYLNFSRAQYHKSCGDLNLAKKYYTNILNFDKSEYRHKALATMFINDLSESSLDYPKDNEIIGFLNDCHAKNCYWGTVRFWES